MRMYYSLSEAAKILGYSSPDTIRVYIHKGVMKGVKIGNAWVIHHNELQKRMKRREYLLGLKQKRQEA